MAASFSNVALAFSICLALTACGGGGDDPAPLQIDQNGLACINVAPPRVATGLQVGRTMVASDVYVFPAESGSQQRTFAPVLYTNASAGTVTLQIATSGARTIQAPKDLAGTTFYQSSVRVLDQTANQFIDAPISSCANLIENLAGGSSASEREVILVNVDVPAGHTVTVTPLGLVAPNVGSIGHMVLTTTDFDMSVTAI